TPARSPAAEDPAISVELNQLIRIGIRTLLVGRLEHRGGRRARSGSGPDERDLFRRCGPLIIGSRSRLRTLRPCGSRRGSERPRSASLIPAEGRRAVLEGSRTASSSRLPSWTWAGHLPSLWASGLSAPAPSA